MGHAAWTIAIGAQMRRAAEAMEKKAGVPFRLFERLCGLAPNDDFIMFLSEISGRPVPAKYRRQRGQLADAMLDGAFPYRRPQARDRRGAGSAVRPSSSSLHEMGAQVTVAVTTTQSPVLERVHADEVLIGDLEDLETLAKEKDCDLLDHPFPWAASRGAVGHSVLSRRFPDVRPAGRRASALGRLSRRRGI